MATTPQLKKIRETKLMTQKALGEAAGVHEITVVRLEGGGNAQFSTIRKLAEALGVDATELL